MASLLETLFYGGRDPTEKYSFAVPPFPTSAMNDIQGYVRRIRIYHCAELNSRRGWTPGDIAIWCEQDPDPEPPRDEEDNAIIKLTYRNKLWSVDARTAGHYVSAMYETYVADMEARRPSRRAEVLAKFDKCFKVAMQAGPQYIWAAIRVTREIGLVTGSYKQEQIQHTYRDMSEDELLDMLAQNVATLVEYCAERKMPLPPAVAGLLAPGTESSADLDPEMFRVDTDQLGPKPG